MKGTLIPALFLACISRHALAGGATAPGPAQQQVDALIDKWVKPADVDRTVAAVALQTIPWQNFLYLEAETDRTDLSAEGRKWLADYVERERPRYALRVRNQARKDIYNHWNQQTAMEQFEKVGRHDPKWDALAKDGLRNFVATQNNHAESYQLLGKAIAAGCDDPFIAYLYARDSEQFADRQTADIRLRDAAKRMAASQYPASRKELAAVRALEHYLKLEVDKYRAGGALPADLKPSLNEMTPACLKGWHEMAAEPGVPEWPLQDIATRLLDLELWPEMDRIHFFEAVYPPLEKALPKSATPLLVKGKFYIKYAWDARGGGWADSVTAEGWRLFGERLAEARKALDAAWAIDPHNSEIAQEMLTVALGENWPRDRMEAWFDRAMAENPDNYQACSRKLYYLEPKWNGSVEQMMAFGHECLEGGNWTANIPFILLEAHRELAQYAGDTYWSKPQVWADVRAIYEPLLKATGVNPYARSAYCYYACRAGKWDVARRQFDTLGDKALAKQFGGKEAMENFRKQAEEKAAEN